ncbi:exopolysaccharide biosynthesis polyprenyl glycosylphosphotransferase [Flavobacteriaceae bacterium AU392]|nr:sugar transferase [Flavobacteriaceae bacterium]RKM82838.1 exopolysaccharide biosynthesis polyprenyl glycosylphosphotransferase [Flavobacteriaceae bacterium AU392]
MSSTKGIHFEISERKILLRLFDILFSLGGLQFICYTFSFNYFSISIENWTWTFILILYITVFGTIFELYDLQKSSKLDSAFKTITLTISVTTLFYFLTPILTPSLPEKRIEIFYFYLTIIASIFIWRFLYVTFIVSPRFYKRVVVIGEISNIDAIIKTINESDPNYKIVGFVNSEPPHQYAIRFNGIKEYWPGKLVEAIQKENINEIVVAIYNSENITPEIYNELTTLLEKGFKIREYTQVFEEITKRVPVQFVGKDFYRYFPFSRSNQNKLYMIYHRFMDIIVSLIGIVLGIILLPFIFIGNLIGNKGALIYTQVRIGKDGEPFTVYKYRTMIPNAESSGAKWADKNDSRVTSFGRFLRKSRLDEIPQFVNVLLGDMSIIGPRPERPFFVKELSQIIPFYETRHSIKPGLSGWAQVNTNYGSTVEDSLTKLQYDLYYIKHRSFFLDLNIIVKTLSTVIHYRGQ